MSPNRLTAAALRTGVATSAGLLGVGILLHVAGGRLAAGTAGAAEWFLSAGLIVLLATPVMRVVIVAGEFLRENEKSFAALAFAVLGSLLATGTVAWFIG